MLSPSEIVHKMYNNDAFSQWLGIKIEHVALREVIVSMRIRSEMLNGFQISHGGISFSLADSAFAFASNSEGQHAVSIETSISLFKKVNVHDELKAYAKNISSSHKIAVFEVEVKREEELVALFKGTVYKSSKLWE
jgi:acyl-CoA thioesterase